MTGAAASAVPLLPADVGPGARGAFTTRAGGVSGGAWGGPDGAGGLNLGLHVGDDPDAVLANRDRLEAAVGAPVAWMDQVHGSAVLEVTAVSGSSQGECDALVARADARSALAVMVADCVPVLLADAAGSVVAAAHVGRQGLVRGVLAAAVDRMVDLGASAENLHAAVGPSICGRCYEVPAALRDEVAETVPGTASTTSWGTPALDLVAGVRRQLSGLGVSSVTTLRACTMEDERFYSYRRAGRAGRAATGRFAGVVGPAGAAR
ncbi:peptidoglycan editing factor PgeF [Georgenia sp. EYE_87]|uniref:peptidoglycan editing factor PgeF n=1 Tax=Georgenia sp. EYE_87 TaxID=2853448 RepID=UPI002006D72E|nr:peptidoglycan editing factor PgeF [Georgenia sp. EYE_87]MCK6212613.1 peptidoglycan editing factor PgeF [Georgenia sp. EYE_87]